MTDTLRKHIIGHLRNRGVESPDMVALALDAVERALQGRWHERIWGKTTVSQVCRGWKLTRFAQ